MHAPFAITSEYFGDTAVISLIGELDTTRCPQLDEALGASLSGGRIHLVVDTAELTFCDSMGLRTFLDYVERARQAGGWLRMAGVRGVLRRLLDVTGVSVVVPIDPDVPTALRARLPGGDALGL
ncbi:STAS domain-containing protein [Nonomuraea harbinensis]|uniref:STAS domain-containing protein n=1 Tax=Nonomuraea harbinensis TaxID=1286938 RepID=A0ABW1C732_9ACTN|nr:STAS domain-containing protein [Nonomuraea harbinensis]